MIAADRYFTRVGQYGTNVEAMKAFHYAPGVTEMYNGREGAACELYHNYWEESGGITMGEFGTDFWGAADHVCLRAQLFRADRLQRGQDGLPHAQPLLVGARELRPRARPAGLRERLSGPCREARVRTRRRS